MEFIIYCHTNRVNGKRYIGQTRSGLAKRWQGHTSNARNRRLSCSFHAAIRKHGESSWEHEVLQCGIASVEEANAAEIKWIAHFRSTERDLGYNLDAGGNAHGTHPDTRAKLKSSAAKHAASQSAAERARARVKAVTTMGPERRMVPARKAAKTRRARRTPCPPDIAAAVKALLGSMPEVQVAARLGVSRATLARLAAGMTVHAGTIAQARAALEKPLVANPAQLSLITV